ncbi:MAG: alpha/beta fold hydrolase [Gammaproteobacteria bacterium]
MAIDETEVTSTIKTNKGSVISYKISYCQNDKNSSTQNERSAVFLIHGLASNMTRWTEFVSNTSLTNGVDLVRLDLRGHGKSMSYSRITILDWCRDIHQILTKEQYSRIILVGHSLGAQIAMQFSFYYPQNTQGVVLIDPVFPDALKGFLGVVRRFRYGLLAIIHLLLLIAKMGLTRKTLPYRDLYELDIKTRKFLEKNSTTDIAKLYMNPFDDLIYIPFVNYCQDMFEVTRKLPDLRLIKCAVLCLLSKGATVSNIALTKKHVSQIPESETTIINADHWLLTEKPTESRKAIENWCYKILTGP